MNVAISSLPLPYSVDLMDSSLAKLYDEHSDMQFERGLDLIKTHLQPRPGQAILDLGCGTGRLAMELASLVGSDGRIVGLDPDKDRIEVAKKTSGSSCAHLTFLEGVAGDAVEVGPFDAIFSNFVLHWVPEENIQSTLCDIERCLKPGGRLLAHITSSTGKLAADLAVLATGEDEESTCGMCFRDLQFWKNHCIDAGLEVGAVSEKIDITIRFSKVTGYFEFVKAYTSGAVDVANVSENDMNKFLQRHELNKLDEDLTINASILKIVATKPV